MTILLQLSLGIAGTAKNTGKTTTMTAILEELRLRGIPVYITSIGYDGEYIDAITGLLKPRLHVEPGDIIATAEQCLQSSTAVLRTLLETEIDTPLGRIFIVQVKKAGLAVTAGPNKSADVKKLASILRQMGPGIVIFDGALNRMAPMAETDGFILATGAAKTPNIIELSNETRLIEAICGLPTVPFALTLLERQYRDAVLLGPDLTIVKQAPSSSLLAANDITELFSEMPPSESCLYIPGVINEKALLDLYEIVRQNSRRLFLAFDNAVKLLMTGQPESTYSRLEDMRQLGAFIGVARRVPLIAVTINPFFYPEYRVKTQTYKPAFIGPVRLEILIKNHVQAPVYNVVRHGAQGLVDTILINRHTWQNPQALTF